MKQSRQNKREGASSNFGESQISNHDIIKSCNLIYFYCARNTKAGSNFHARHKGLKFSLLLLGANEADIPFFGNRNEFVVPYCRLPLGELLSFVIYTRYV